MSEIIQKLQKNIEAIQRIINDESLIGCVYQASDLIIDSLKKGNKAVFFGNGGSAADAQHLAAELMGRYLLDREPLPALALTTNTSNLTAIGNDFGYDEVFLRQLKGIGRKGDAVVGISTSGNSRNVIKAMEYAKSAGMKVIAFTGQGGGAMKDHADVLIAVPSKETPIIQECQIMIGHIICELVEKEFAK